MEKHAKVSTSLVDIERDREHYQKKCEEFQRKLEKQAEDFNKELCLREKQIEQMT